MIAARFRQLGWIAGVAGAALSCYMASQWVAAERGALAKVDAEITDTRGEIDRLTTEITARSRAGQLERWNATLALQAARPVQYVATGFQLASMAGGQKLPLDPAIVASQGAVNVVSYQQPAPTPQPAAAAPQAAPAPHPQAALHVATFVRPQSQPLADAAPVLIKASYEKPAPPRTSFPSASFPRKRVSGPDIALGSRPRAGDEAVAKKPALKLAAAKPARKAGLLPDDLGALVAAEKKKRS